MSKTLLRRFALLGDIHAEDERLAVALRFLSSLAPDAILAVGDITDGKGDVARCCALLREHGAIAVRGNHERWFVAGTMRDLPDATQDVDPDTGAYLASLPAVHSVSTVRGELLLCHGLGEDDMAGVRPDDEGYALHSNDALSALVTAGRYRWVAAGHTHRRMVRRFEDLTVINAGTLYRDHDPCFAFVDLEARQATFYRADRSIAPERLERVRLP